MPLTSPQLDLSPAAASGLRIDQYLGAWAIEQSHGLALWRHVQALNLASHIQAHRHERFDEPAARIVTAGAGNQAAGVGGSDGAGLQVGIVSLEGALTKRGSSFSEQGSTMRARREIRSLAADADVGAIIVRLDSPGGTVSGTHDLAADVRSASQRKPVIAFIEDLGASAAYLVASQADQVFANEPGALVGSIGVLWGLYDSSSAHAQAGFKPVLITSGGLKGTGFEGTEVTVEQQQYLQELVNDANGAFLRAVSAGRRVSLATVQEWNTGRVWPAAEAQQMGLIDGVQSLDATITAAFEAGQSRKPRRKAIGMPSENQTITANTSDVAAVDTPAPAPAPAAEQPATFQQIQQVCGGIQTSQPEDAMFVSQQQAQGATVAQVQANWMQTLTDRVGAARQERDERPVEQPGVDPVNATSASADGDGTSTTEFWSAVAEKQQSGMPRGKAVSAVVRENPGLHQEMLTEVNANRPSRRP